MSHDRCYRNRITHRYYLNSASGGTDFVKLDGTAETPNPWARSTCGLAVMPANGMLYNGPYVCQCAIGTMATGVNGFYNGSGILTVASPSRSSRVWSKGLRLEKARALPPRRMTGRRIGIPACAAESRRDELPEELATKWKVNVGSHPTAPVVAGESVYVADRDGYTLYSLNRENGRDALVIHRRRTHRQSSDLLQGHDPGRQSWRLGLLPASVRRSVGVEVQWDAASVG